MFVKHITELNLEEAKVELLNLRNRLTKARRDITYTQAGKRGIAERISFLLNKFPTLKN
jgi:hypothetical protein